MQKATIFQVLKNVRYLTWPKKKHDGTFRIESFNCWCLPRSSGRVKSGRKSPSCNDSSKEDPGCICSACHNEVSPVFGRISEWRKDTNTRYCWVKKRSDMLSSSLDLCFRNFENSCAKAVWVWVLLYKPLPKSGNRLSQRADSFFGCVET